jgi:hypothetical protein
MRPHFPPLDRQMRVHKKIFCACDQHHLQHVDTVIYLHIPSNCVMKAVESSRGTAELAPAISIN